MDASRTHRYHLVKFFSIQNNRLSKVFCIPGSWVRWEDKECLTVLTAYPFEPPEITRERVRKYENPGSDWNMYLALVKYSTDFYDNVIHRVNECEQTAEESRDFRLIVTEAESPYGSYSSEFLKRLNMLRNSIDPNCSMVNGMDAFPKLKSEPIVSAIDLDSGKDVPCDFSLSSPKNCCIKEREHSTDELCYPEVIITKVESPGCSSWSNASQHPKMHESNVFLSGLLKWFLDLPNLADPRLSIMNRADEVSQLQYKAFRTVIDQDRKDGDDDDVNRDWSISSSGMVQLSGASSLSENLLNNPRHIDNKWTLKHREYSPGLLELWPDTGVYIRHSELDDCLKNSYKCTQLARLLTVHVFSQLALRKCQYVNTMDDSRGPRLDPGAINAIVNFVLKYGSVRNWRCSSDRSIKKAIRYQLILSKKKI